jgi:hypothetical protein
MILPFFLEHPDVPDLTHQIFDGRQVEIAFQ